MVSIEPLDADSPSPVLDSARELFSAYADFLHSTGHHSGFNFDRLLQEASELPAPYTAANGAVLVAIVDRLSVGCIVFRAHPARASENACEIKRLLVLPEYRGSSIGFRIARAALDLARVKGYRIAYLDTEPAAMPAAHRTYLKLGFEEYEKRGCGPTAVSFLRKSLT